MRVVKKPEDRKNELLEIAEKLFVENDYEKVNVSDIVKKASVSQGIFYYYFKSKEDIFLTIFDRKIKSNVDGFTVIIKDGKLSGIEKIKKIIQIDSEFSEKYDNLICHLHKQENAGLHQKMIISYIQNYKPVFTSIIRDGILNGEFMTDYPEETAEFILTIGKFLFDPGLFGFNEQDYERRLVAMSYSIERLLHIPYGHLNLLEDLKKYNKNMVP